MAWASALSEARLPPLGNSFVADPQALGIQCGGRRIQRSQSFAGYIPYRLEGLAVQT